MGLHIIIDFNPILRHRFSGFWTYGQGLLGGLCEHPDIDRLTLLCWRDIMEQAGDFPARSHPKVRLLPTRIRMRRLERWWNMVPWPALQNWAGSFDVYHCMHQMIPPIRDAACVLTVHDLRTYRLPEIYPKSRKGRFERAVRRADRIITYSDSTRRDLVELLGVQREKVDMSHLATPAGFEPATPRTTRQTLGWLSTRFGRAVSAYALAVGSPDKRKNIAGAIRGFAQAASSLPEGYCLVLAGKMPRNEDIDALIHDQGLSGRVLVTGPLDHENFRNIFASAHLLLFLSLYEGFGLPLLESMATGVPVISSSRSSMPEVIGPAGIIVDPLDARAVADEIIHLQIDPQLRQSLIDKGLNRCREFTWQRTAAQTVECYRKAIASKST